MDYEKMTSTGVGLQYRRAQGFPPLDFKRRVTEPLPPLLSQDKHIIDNYITSTGAAHDFKLGYPSSSLQNDIHKKAAGHWNVEYNKDTIAKIEAHPQRRPLTMANQESEMTAQFTGNGPALSLDRFYSSSLKCPMDHATGQVKTRLPRPTSAEKMRQNQLVDRGVFNYHGDNHLSTMKKEYRPCTKEELKEYPQKSFASFWNYNPKRLITAQREGPMRDEIVFNSPTTADTTRKPLPMVPNSGMCSEFIGSYRGMQPSNSYRPTWTRDTTELPSEDIFSVPKMYKTEYENIGSGRPQPV